MKDCHLLSVRQIKIHHVFKMQFGGYFVKFNRRQIFWLYGIKLCFKFSSILLSLSVGLYIDIHTHCDKEINWLTIMKFLQKFTLTTNQTILRKFTRSHTVIGSNHPVRSSYEIRHQRKCVLFILHGMVMSDTLKSGSF